MTSPTSAIGQALADVATISLLHERNLRHSDILNEQLQTALNSRVVIEQAKGKLAERLGLDMEQAFNLLRDYARNRNLRLADLAQAFIDGTQTLTLPARQRQPGRPAPPRGPATPPLNEPGPLPGDRHQPTAPSICSSISRFSSSAYSIGSSRAIGSTKPRTIVAIASSSVMPRLIR